jgi:hypothetical protein
MTRIMTRPLRIGRLSVAIRPGPRCFSAAFLLFAFVPAATQAAMPLQTSPVWTSAPDGHYATGGAWADVDGDGWLDMVVSNGNDMARQTLVIYHNNGDGTLPLHPTWSATDIDYHGHLDVGDINGDGLVDVAVGVYIGAAGFSQPGRVKVYLNDGAGAFHATPDWIAADPVYCFSVALGDADGDGDLDLACACGDDYQTHPERQRIFFNQNGTLETTPSWRSSETGYALDVCWGDVDEDGDLDVAFCGASTPLRLYRNGQTQGAGIATTASWQNTDLPEHGNTSAFGDWNGDGYPELAVADNNQMGGAGRFKVYANLAGTLGTTPLWLSNDGGYGSHVSWIDLDLDDDLDLVTGRWWGACRIYENTGGTLTLQPVWVSTTNSVVENMFYGDLDNAALRDTGRTLASGDGARTFFPLGTAPVYSVDGVWVDGVPQPATAYAAHLGNGWISFDTPPPSGLSNVSIHYSYSIENDLGVTNWDPDIGNYVFQNDGVPTGTREPALAMADLHARPNPLVNATWLRHEGPRGSYVRLRILDVNGRLVRTLHDGPIDGERVTWEWDRRDDGGRRVTSGTYFARLDAAENAGRARLVVLD